MRRGAARAIRDAQAGRSRSVGGLVLFFGRSTEDASLAYFARLYAAGLIDHATLEARIDLVLRGARVPYGVLRAGVEGWDATMGRPL